MLKWNIKENRKIKVSNEQEMSPQYNSTSDGKYQNEQDNAPDWHVCISTMFKTVHSTCKLVNRKVLLCHNKE